MWRIIAFCAALSLAGCVTTPAETGSRELTAQVPKITAGNLIDLIHRHYVTAYANAERRDPETVNQVLEVLEIRNNRLVVKLTNKRTEATATGYMKEVFETAPTLTGAQVTVRFRYVQNAGTALEQEIDAHDAGFVDVASFKRNVAALLEQVKARAAPRL